MLDETIDSIGTLANSPLKINFSQNFQIICLLGQGTFSKVYKVLRIADRKMYAMKKIAMKFLTKHQ